MIKYAFKRKVDSLVLKVTGHANYAEYGKDIVCASISSLVQYVGHMVKVCDLTHKSTFEIGEITTIYATVNEFNHIVMLNLIKAIESIESQYPQNIKRVKFNEFNNN